MIPCMTIAHILIARLSMTSEQQISEQELLRQLIKNTDSLCTQINGARTDRIALEFMRMGIDGNDKTALVAALEQYKQIRKVVNKSL